MTVHSYRRRAESIIPNKLADKGIIAIFFGYVFAVALTGGLLAQIMLGWPGVHSPDGAG